MAFAKLDNFELFYECYGTGAPIILIPGFASGAWSWFRQTEDLAKNFQVITFDPRGVSRSLSSNGAEASVKTIAEDVKTLLDELKIQRANVLGASFGGFVAQKFALLFPERLNKLILACTSFGGKNHVAPDLEILLAFASTENLNKSERIRNFMRPAFTPEFRAAHNDIVEKVCALREQNVVPEAIYLAQLQSATTFDAELRVREIKAETLILTGDNDAVVPPQNSANLARAIPNARLEIIKGGSHMFFIEKAEEFNKIITDFLEEI
ncbi:MAG: alpha/beta hydrolase [Acidobacteriota bacterium]|nr:alpha/beta hydrolase [Acidobacteriota bacterium]